MRIIGYKRGNNLNFPAWTSLLTQPEVSRPTLLRRCTPIFSQGQVADSVYFIADGLMKLVRTSDTGGRVILAIVGPGGLLGEEVLDADNPSYQTDAESLTAATAHRISRESLRGLVAGNAEFATGFIDYILKRKLALARKIELLCFRDVEFRILHYLAELAAVVKPVTNGEGYQLPITQAELADLIGATRETTSTTLNQLERRGLVKLSRRLLTVVSTSSLREVISREELPPSQMAAGGI